MEATLNRGYNGVYNEGYNGGCNGGCNGAMKTHSPVDGHEQHDSSAPGGRCRSYVQQEQGGHQQGGAQEDPPPAHGENNQ